MFNRAKIFEAATPLLYREGPVDVERIVRQIARTHIPVPGAPARYPRYEHLSDYSSVFATPLMELPAPLYLDALEEVLRRPQRVAPLIREESNARRYAMFSAFAAAALEDPFIVTCTVTLPPSFAIEVEVVGVDDADALLQRLYLATVTSERRVEAVVGRVVRIAWVGGAALAGGAPSNWRELVAAACAVRGVEIAVFEEPFKRVKQVREQIARLNPDSILIWQAFAEPTPWTALKGGNGAIIPALVVESLEFSDVLVEAQLALDEARVAEVPPDTGNAAPTLGEVRFFKKHYATPNHDVMLESTDCGHGAWERASKAPKAEKGIARQSAGVPFDLDKCVRCTGGGHWRVTYCAT